MLHLRGTIEGIRLKISKGLGFESLKFRRWFRSCCFFISIYSIIISSEIVYLAPIIRIKLKHYCRIDLFKYSFFPYTAAEWKKLAITLRNAKLFFDFQKLSIKNW